MSYTRPEPTTKPPIIAPIVSVNVDLVKCNHCGQNGDPNFPCKYCGAPIYEQVLEYNTPSFEESLAKHVQFLESTPFLSKEIKRLAGVDSEPATQEIFTERETFFELLLRSKMFWWIVLVLIVNIVFSYLQLSETYYYISGILTFATFAWVLSKFFRGV